jgi:2-oxoglutarate ferredoxin oxidoreductase subunit alpha
MVEHDLSRRSLSVAIVGSGGAGVMTAGKLLLEAAAGCGWYGLMTKSFGPQIRGGEAAAMIRISGTPVEIHDDQFDVLLAVDWNNYETFSVEIPLSSESLVIADLGAGETPESVALVGARTIDLPLSTMVEEIEGARANMIALGVVAGLLGIPLSKINDLILARLSSKGEAAISSGRAAVAAGEVAIDSLNGEYALAPVQASKQERWFITGNEAAGLGALRGGVRFVAAYPITPATDLLEWMAPELGKLGGTLVQAEDELASINMVIGASFGGVPSLTATSGPGLALMTESIGLSVAAEVPVVIVDVMRCGPSTGIATKSEQSDLNIAVYGCHGDAPHIVVAPTSIQDCLFTTQWATHLAEAMQTPAIVLSDQALGQAQVVIDAPGEVAFVARREAPDKLSKELSDYRRYAATASGISPMVRPGTVGCSYTADGLEHNEAGIPSSNAAVHRQQLDKRRHKIESFNYGQHWADHEGEGDLAVITWGSSTQPVREALQRASTEGMEARLIALRLISPAQPEKLTELLEGVGRVLVVEQSHSGQFYRYLRAYYDLPGDVTSFFRPGPLPLRVGEIHKALTEW